MKIDGKRKGNKIGNFIGTEKNKQMVINIRKKYEK